MPALDQGLDFSANSECHLGEGIGADIQPDQIEDVVSQRIVDRCSERFHFLDQALGAVMWPEQSDEARTRGCQRSECLNAVRKVV